MAFDLLVVHIYNKYENLGSTMRFFNYNKLGKTAFAVFLGVFILTGCSVNNDPLTRAQVIAANQLHLLEIMDRIEPFGEILSLQEAIARGLKYNLDHRLALLEVSVAAGKVDSGRFDMLPEMMTTAGYDGRNNYGNRYSAPADNPNNLSTDVPSISTELGSNSVELKLSWDLVDFGIGYFNSIQSSDRLVIAEQQRRRTIHNLIQEIRSSYWSAFAAQKTRLIIEETIKNASIALEQSRSLRAEQESNPREALNYQRNLLENLRLLEATSRKLNTASIDLSKLIGVLPGAANYKLQEPAGSLDIIEYDIEELEQIALTQNTDLLESIFDIRIAVVETKKAIANLLPGISLNYGMNYSDDQFLVNNRWVSAGTSITYNLMQVLQARSGIKNSRLDFAVSVERKLAVQMAVLAKLHISRLQYEDAKRQYNLTEELYLVDKDLQELTAGSAESEVASQQELIASTVTSILSEVRLYESMGEAQLALGQLYSTLGLEPNVPSLDKISLSELSEKVFEWLNASLSVRSENVVD